MSNIENKKLAISRNPFGAWIASFKQANGNTEYCVFNTEMDAIRWVNFNKDYLIQGSSKIDKITK